MNCQAHDVLNVHPRPWQLLKNLDLCFECLHAGGRNGFDPYLTLYGNICSKCIISTDVKPETFKDPEGRRRWHSGSVDQFHRPSQRNNSELFCFIFLNVPVVWTLICDLF